MSDDLLNPPGRPCRCDGEGCREAAAYSEPGRIARAIDRDKAGRHPAIRVALAQVAEEVRAEVERPVAPAALIRMRERQLEQLENREYATSKRPPRFLAATILGAKAQAAFRVALDCALNAHHRQETPDA